MNNITYYAIDWKMARKIINNYYWMCGEEDKIYISNTVDAFLIWEDGKFIGDKNISFKDSSSLPFGVCINNIYIPCTISICEEDRRSINFSTPYWWQYENDKLRAFLYEDGEEPRREGKMDASDNVEYETTFDNHWDAFEENFDDILEVACEYIGTNFQEEFNTMTNEIDTMTDEIEDLYDWVGEIYNDADNSYDVILSLKKDVDTLKKEIKSLKSNTSLCPIDVKENKNCKLYDEKGNLVGVFIPMV